MRKCNECTLCCKLLPVAEIRKPANTPCTQQRSKGCRVYHTDKFPRACRLWNCLWLIDDSIALPRPDRAHYVLDADPDFVRIEGHQVLVLQVWVDPRFPNAHRDPSLRAWLELRYETHHQLPLIRYSSTDGFVLFPPASTGDGWIEAKGTADREHTIQERLEAMMALSEIKGGPRRRG